MAEKKEEKKTEHWSVQLVRLLFEHWDKISAVHSQVAQSQAARSARFQIPRDPDEPVWSPRVLVWCGASALAAILYNHADPFPRARGTDKFAVDILAGLLILRVLIPQDQSIGSQPYLREFERRVLALVDPDERPAVKRWFERMRNRKEVKLVRFLDGASAEEILEYLESEEVRRETSRLFGLHVQRGDLARAIRDARRAWQRNWRAIQPIVHDLDVWLACRLVPVHAALLRTHVRMEQIATRPPDTGHWYDWWCRGPHEQGWHGFWRYVKRLLAGK